MYVFTFGFLCFRMVSLSKNVTVDEDGSAEFRCEIDANPMTKSTIQWDLPDHPNESKPGHDWRDRSQIIFKQDQMVSVLRITGIERGDTGRVVCIASNGVKDDIQSLATHLIVNRECLLTVGCK